MLHKYYYRGKTRNDMDMFESITDDEFVSWPNAAKYTRQMVENFSDELDISGYVKCLYLERPERTNRYWNVVVAVWNNENEYIKNSAPYKVLRVRTDNLDEPVRDKYTDEYTTSLPISVYQSFAAKAGRITF